MIVLFYQYLTLLHTSKSLIIIYLLSGKVYCLYMYYKITMRIALLIEFVSLKIENDKF